MRNRQQRRMKSEFTILGSVSSVDQSEDMTHPDHFVFSTAVGELLFERIKISTAGGVFAASLVLMVVAISYEGIRLLRKYLMLRSSEDERSRNNVPSTDVDERRDERMPLRNGTTETCLNCSCDILVQSFLHMVQMLIGYLLMLSVMTYNAWLLFAILIGAGLGAYLLGGQWSFKRTAQFEVRVSSNLDLRPSEVAGHSGAATDIQIGHQTHHQHQHGQQEQQQRT